MKFAQHIPAGEREYAIIRSIYISHDGTRTTSVTSPSDGRRYSHGLGVVGKPLSLGHRAEGYFLKLSGTLRVYVTARHNPTRRGKLEDLKAPGLSDLMGGANG